MTSLDHRNPPTDLWSGPAADLAAAAGASFAPAPAAEPAHPEPAHPGPARAEPARPQPPTDRIAPAPFDELIDTEPSRHVAAAHATSYGGVENLPDDYAYYPPVDGAHSAPGRRTNRDTRTTSSAERRAAAHDHAPATATGSSGDRGDSGTNRRGTGGKGRPRRSRAAIGAAVVAGTAMAGTFAFILTNGSSPDPQAGGSADTGRDSVVTSAAPSNPPVPAAPSTAKADRKPAAPKPSTQKTTVTKTPNTGPASPKFRSGQWIAVIDTYPTDAGMAADQLAKELAGKLINAGVPARAMLADGQYPGIVDGGEPTTATWIVFVGPATSSQNAMNACISPKVQKIHENNACPTYEPATSLD
ncbi:hypothetical protein [Kribbella sp. NPDC051770]|uniref:hypothetical protein n=1 Tax=Kribbella sp. NPDC051770 TaxID=3155413 RepID=UPI003436C593